VCLDTGRREGVGAARSPGTLWVTTVTVGARIVYAGPWGRPLALARDRSEYDKVTASLTAGLVAMSSQNWGALFANSPAPRKPWLSSYALTHVLPAAVLGAAALVLPRVPPFRHGSLAAGSIRVSLVSFAVLRLVPGPALSDLVDKALGRGFDSTKR